MTQPTTAAAPAAQPGNWVDPLRAYNFKLLINNVTEGHFTEVSGLSVQVERISYREGGNNSIVHAIPGRGAELQVRCALPKVAVRHKRKVPRLGRGGLARDDNSENFQRAEGRAQTPVPTVQVQSAATSFSGFTVGPTFSFCQALKAS